jgi:ankyrin repeat domain-containing protein 50
MLRSLIRQLSSQIPTLSSALDTLYVEHLNGERQPSDTDLSTLLGNMLTSMEHNYLILDALDECDDLRHLLSFLTKLVIDKSRNLHLLVTSRNEIVIEQSLTSYKQVHLNDMMVADDIHTFVTEQLGHSEFDKLPDNLRLEIISRLTGDADGMSVSKSLLHYTADQF